MLLTPITPVLIPAAARHRRTPPPRLFVTHSAAFIGLYKILHSPPSQQIAVSHHGAILPRRSPRRAFRRSCNNCRASGALLCDDGRINHHRPHGGNLIRDARRSHLCYSGGDLHDGVCICAVWFVRPLAGVEVRRWCGCDGVRDPGCSGGGDGFLEAVWRIHTQRLAFWLGQEGGKLQQGSKKKRQNLELEQEIFVPPFFNPGRLMNSSPTEQYASAFLITSDGFMKMLVVVHISTPSTLKEILSN